MATTVNQSLVKTEKKETPVVVKMLQSKNMVERFETVIKGKAPQFLAGLIAAVNQNPDLQKADPNSVLASAMIAASLDLSVVPSFGFAAIIPYGDKAQFQIMYKGLIQMALRSGEYKHINVTEVYADEYRGYNPITGEVDLNCNIPNGDRANDRAEKIVGYAAYFSFVNGYEHTEYWSKEKVAAHGKKYSKTYTFKSGKWQTDFDAMAKKTVLKNALSKWGILSVEMQKAVTEDQKVYTDRPSDGVYMDNPNVVVDKAPVVEEVVEEVKQAPMPPKQEPVVSQVAPQPVTPQPQVVVEPSIDNGVINDDELPF